MTHIVQLFPFGSQLVVLTTGLLPRVVYGWQARSKGNQVKWGWRWQGGKLFFGGVADQSDLIKVIQPVLPTTFLCLFSSVYVRRVISTTERKMDGEVKRWRPGRLWCLCTQSHSEEAEGQGTAEVRGPERRDVVAMCLQATVTQRTVALCVSSSEFRIGYHCKRIIKSYLRHWRQLVNFSGTL